MIQFFLAQANILVDTWSLLYHHLWSEYEECMQPLNGIELNFVVWTELAKEIE